MSSIEASLTASQLRWTGHIMRINDSLFRKVVLYGKLAKGNVFVVDNGCDTKM